MASIDFKDRFGNTVIGIGPIIEDGRFPVRISRQFNEREIWMNAFWEFDKGQIPYFYTELLDLKDGNLKEAVLLDDCGNRIRITSDLTVYFNDYFEPGIEDSGIKFQFSMDQTNLQELIDCVRRFIKEYKGVL